MTDDVAMAPAYGGMFRPPPPHRRVGWIIAGVVMVIALVLAAIVSGLFLWRQHQRFAENGRPCTTGCVHGKCIHDPGDSYCGSECSSDSDCPSAFVCEPTLSGRHHVCLKSGVDTRTGGLRRGR